MTCPLISGLMYQNCPQNISQSTMGAIQNGLKSGLGGESGSDFETALTATAAKVEA